MPPGAPPTNACQAHMPVQALSQLLPAVGGMHVWVRLPFTGDAAADAAAWQWWHAVRTLCGYHPSLALSLDISAAATMAAFNRRWRSEAVHCAALPLACFQQNRKGFPVLPPSLQTLVKGLMSMGIQVCRSCWRLKVQFSRPTDALGKQTLPASVAQRPWHGMAGVPRLLTLCSAQLAWHSR